MYLLQAFERLDKDDREIIQTFLDVDTLSLERSLVGKLLSQETADDPSGSRRTIIELLQRQRRENFFAVVQKNYAQQYRFFKNTERLLTAKDHSLRPIYEFGQSLRTQQEILNERALDIFPDAFLCICEATRNQLERSGNSIHSIFASSGNYSRLLKSVFVRDTPAFQMFEAIDYYMLHGKHFYNQLENILAGGIRSNIPATHLLTQLSDSLAQAMNLYGDINDWRIKQTSMLMDDPYLCLLESLESQRPQNN